MTGKLAYDETIPKYKGRVGKVATSLNPQWYSDMYWSNNRFERRRSLKALKRIINGTDGRYGCIGEKRGLPFHDYTYKFATVYRGLILERLAEGYRGLHGEPHAADFRVARYFGIKPKVTESSGWWTGLEAIS